MAILPPQCYVEIPCPFCGQPSAFVDAEHQPDVFMTVLSFDVERTPPITLAFVCGHCQVYMPPEMFSEKVAEVTQAQREQHHFWKTITAALGSMNASGGTGPH